jgi:hypothetical protein
MGPSAFKTELVRIARAENEALGSFRRGNQQLEDRITHYAGGVGIALTPSVRAHYSAVFISWCMYAAGASAPEFPPVIAHYKYASFALQNARSESGLFWARRIENYAPQLGDLIHFNRDSGNADFEQIGRSYLAESGIVVGLDYGQALVVVGNQEPFGNIGSEEFVLDETGLLKQRAVNPFICVIEVGK